MKRLNYSLAAVILAAALLSVQAEERGGVDLIGQYYHTLINPQSITVAGDYAYVVDLRTGFFIYNVSDPVRPRLTGVWDGRGDWCYNVVVDGATAYVVVPRAIFAVDVSDPSNPQTIGVFRGQAGIMTRASLRGDYLVVADESVGLLVVDVSNPADMRLAGLYRTPNHGGEASNGFISAVHISDQLVVAAHINRGLTVFDISRPGEPVIASELETDGFIPDLAHHGDYIFAAGDRGLMVYRIVNGIELREAAEVNRWFRTTGIEIEGSHAYLTSHVWGEHFDFRGRTDVIDISSPEEPELVGSLDLANSPLGLAKKDSFLYALTDAGTIDCIDVKDREHPAIVNTIDEGGVIANATIKGDLAYIINNHEGLSILNVSDPSAPRELDSYPEAGASAVVVDHSYAYLASDASGLTILDVSDPSDIQMVSSIRSSSRPVDLAIEDGYVYLLTEWEGLEVFDVLDPESPCKVGEYRLESEASAIDVENSIIYIAYYDGLLALDAFDPTAPRYFSSIQLGILDDVVVDGYTAYVVSWQDSEPYDGLTAVDLSDPMHPDAIGGIDLGNHLTGLALEGNYIYAADGLNGIHIVDISDARNPLEVARYDTRGFAAKLAVRNRMIYLADWNNLGIYRFSPPNGIGSEANDPALTAEVQLGPAYPNPFNNIAHIQWTAPRSALSTISLFDVAGVKVCDLYNGSARGGWNSLPLQANGIAAGTYFVRLASGGKSAMRMVKLIK